MLRLAGYATVTIPGLILCVGALGMAALAAYARRRRDFPGRPEFVRMMLAAAWWSVAAALENFALAPESKVFWAEMAWPGIVAAPTFWAMFVWIYCRGERGVRSPLIRAVAWGLPSVAWGLALSNDLHRQIYHTATPMGTLPGAPILYEHGPLFFVIVAFCYLCLLLGLLATVAAAQWAPSIHRRRYLGLLVAAVIPCFSNVGYVSGVFYLFGFDPTPFCFLLTGGVFFWLVERGRLFSLPPVALRPLLDGLPDAVLVLDDDGTVVEANAAALPLAAVEGASPVGHPLPPALAEALAPLLERGEAEVEGELCLGLGDRSHEVRIRTLWYDGNRLGRMLVLNDITRRKEAELRLTEELKANQVLQERLRDRANRDLLTGLHNRNFLQEMRDSLLAEVRAGRGPLTAVMIDLDHFKELNDTWGHPVGDACLRATAHFLEDRVRHDDLIVRIGGEEILVLLPQTSARQALAGVERWRADYCARPMILRGQAVEVSFSAGIAESSSAEADWDQLILRADQALYRAKGNGRNRVCLWRDEAFPSTK
jgi:diguanylate cyclase (GGDEF)-like protein